MTIKNYKQTALTNNRKNPLILGLIPCNPRYMLLQHDLFILERPIAIPHFDDSTLACLRLWLSKAAAVLYDIVYPNSTTLNSISTKPTATTLAKWKAIEDANIEFLESDFLEDILEIAGLLDLKRELISPIIDLHRYYNQSDS